jgi:hypothetical protein
MARTVLGIVRDTNGSPLPNLRVRAWDEDSPSDDDLMGAAFTDSNGHYTISYRGGDWDTALPGMTTWRPDIYVTVEVPNNSGGYTRIARSRTYHDHKLGNDLTVDFVVQPLPTGPLTKVIAFDPKRHGFHFSNNAMSPPCCGGMSAGALNRFNNNAPAPAVTTPPPTGDSLYLEIFNRQVGTLPPEVLATIGTWQMSPDEPNPPFGLHSLSFRTKQQWPGLCNRINNNKPTVLVLIETEGVTDPSKNHQVLAFGYEWNPTTKDLKIYIYDPNYPDQTMYLTMTLSGDKLRGRHSAGGSRMRGFFVNPAGDAAAT